MLEDQRRLNGLLTDLKAAVGSLVLLLPDAYERQWSPGLIQTRRETEGGRPIGGPPSDPTGEAATDPRRLRLRAAVIAAEREIEAATEAVQTAEARLAEALKGWAGETRV